MIDVIVTFFIEIVFERMLFGIWSLLEQVFLKLKSWFTIKKSASGIAVKIPQPTVRRRGIATNSPLGRPNK